MRNTRTNCDGETYVATERKKKAEDFLRAVIYPSVERRENIDEERLGASLGEYKRKHSGIGDDFEMGMVLGRLLDHLSKYPASILDNGRPIPQEAERALRALAHLSDLDFQAVDEIAASR